MSTNESMLDVYIYENLQLLEQLEGLLLAGEKSERFSGEQVDAIFRILHTIKGSSAMMGYETLTQTSHGIEDLFAHIRENPNQQSDHRLVCDLVFATEDFIRGEMDKLQKGNSPDGNADDLLAKIHAHYNKLKGNSAGGGTEPVQSSSEPAKTPVADTQNVEIKGNVFKATVFFLKDCKMENVRAFGIIKAMESLSIRTASIPQDVLKEHSEEEIISNGFTLFIESDRDLQTIKNKIAETLFIRSLEVEEINEPKDKLLSYFIPELANAPQSAPEQAAAQNSAPAEASAQQRQSFMSVNLDKLDQLLNLVGEIVITESTVTKNPEVTKLHLDSFEKAARQLRKLTDELQDSVMSIRMIPISATFHRMERIVRDISRKSGKEADLIISGEETEMDKSVIDNLGDPLMHIIRNSIDHGVELPEDRVKKGKNRVGRITLDARNTGGDILITITDDGTGLDKKALIKKGIEKGLIKKPASEVLDQEAYNLIFLPGFSTNEVVTEFSGRGVGMDVALKNIEKMGGSISVDSTPGQGTVVRMRIPLTLAIIGGMQVAVGESIFILPILNIRESFKPTKKDVFKDPDGNEMIMLRNVCYPVVRLHRLFGIENNRENFEDGILVLMDSDKQSYCLFVDSLVGEHQTVIKPLPNFVSHMRSWTRGLAGCTILGDGNVCLILDINALIR